ncbi:hypothetical protein [Mesorhizobium sp. A623]
MNKILGAAAMLVVATVPAVAEMRYDRNLEKAAMAIVASKIGDIRGGFTYKQKVQLVVRNGDARRTVNDAGDQPAGGVSQGSPPPASASPSITAF